MVGRDETAELSTHSPNSSRRNSCSAVASRRKRSTASSTRWCGCGHESLLKSRRQYCTARLRVHEERFADIVASQPEIVAHHFTEAGLVDPAIDYWLKAGHSRAQPVSER